MRILIAGLGGIGAMAAWRLAQAGHEVIGVEQFQQDHDMGSSFGDSRIVRRVYPDPLYTKLMENAYTLWHELQAQFPEEELFRLTGGIFFGPEKHPQIQRAQEALSQTGTTYKVLSWEECQARFPAIRFLKGEVAVYDSEVGYVRASKCVRAAYRLAAREGATLLTGKRIVSIARSRNGIQVTTEAGEMMYADRLLLCAGAWIGPLLKQFGLKLPLVVTRQPYIYLKPEQNEADFSSGKFPIWIDAAANMYGFPLLGDLPGVKIALHDPGDVTTPESVCREVTAEDRAAIYRYTASRLPDLAEGRASPSYEKVCLYTSTPDQDFVIDTLPDLPEVIVVSGCSGHGFKFTPLLGEIAACMATDAPVQQDISRFTIARFPHTESCL